MISVLQSMEARKHAIEALIADFLAIKRGLGYSADHKPEITAAQWNVLSLLVHGQHVTVKDVAAKLGISSSAATQLIDALVKGGHIVRKESTEDRRLVELSLSPKTSAKIKALREKHIERLAAVFESLSDTEFAEYARLNKKIAQAVGKNVSK